MSDRRSLMERAVEYVQRFADETDQPEGGDCRLLVEMRQLIAASNPMSREQKLNMIYRKTHKKYKGREGNRPDGGRVIRILRKEGPVTVPLTALTDAEIASHLRVL